MRNWVGYCKYNTPLEEESSLIFGISAKHAINFNRTEKNHSCKRKSMVIIMNLTRSNKARLSTGLHKYLSCVMV